eukprot:scaffold9859_cov122-Isochrysis_galbana.AAC.4
MPKGGKSQDFKKRKQKLGKKKLAPTSTTSTQFKARSVVLLEQSQYAEGRDEQAKSRRSLTLPELLTQLRHYSADVRRDAVRGMSELLADYPAVLLTHASELLSAAAPLIADTSGRVRRALLAFLGTVLEKLESAAALMPHESILRLHLQAALSHEQSDVRTDAVDFIALLLRARPAALVPAPPLLLPTLVELLGSTAQTAAAAGGFPLAGSGGGSSKGGAAPSSAGQRSADRQAVVLNVIRAILTAQGASSAGEDGWAGGAEAEHREPPAWPSLGHAYARWRGKPIPAPCHGTLSSVSAAATASAPSALWEQLRGLPTVLGHCWLELGVWLPTSPADGPSMDSASSLVALLRQLLQMCGPTDPTAAAASSGAAALSSGTLRVLMRHVAPHAPLPPPPASAASALRWHRLNQSLCLVLSEALAHADRSRPEPHPTRPPLVAGSAAAQAAAAQAAEVAALRTRLTSFACSELGQAHHSGRLDGHHGASGGTVSFSASPAKGRQTGACDELVAACRALLDVCRQAGAAHQERALLDSLVGLWADAPAASPVRMPLLCLLEDALLGSADVGPGASGGSRAGAGPGGGSGDADVLATWARSLPKLLWQLHDRQPQLSCALLRSLRRLADSSVGSARAELLSSVQPSLEPFFCSRGRDGRPPILGPFLALPPPARRLALHTSLRSAPISPRLLAAIARCALAGAAAPALRRAALEIVGAVEAAGHCHALSLQSRVSFYATLLRETAAAAQAAGGTASQPHGPEAHPPVGQAAETINESGVGEGSLTLAEFRAKTLEALRRAEVQGGAVVTEAVARFAWAPATLS